MSRMGQDDSLPNQAPDVLELAVTAQEMIRALRDLWTTATYKPEHAGSSSDPGIVTEVESPEALRLPATGFPVRGRRGVVTRLRKSERKWTGAPSISSLVVCTLIDAQLWPHRPADFPPEMEIVHRRYRELVRSLVATAPLAQRILDCRGFKHHEPSELDAIVRRPDLDMAMGLDAPLADAFSQAGFTWESRNTFDGWERVTREFLAICHELQVREFHEYEAIALLNGPLIDSTEPVELDSVSLEGELLMVVLAYATDEDLTAGAAHLAYEERLSPVFENANTIVSFQFKVPVDARVEAYLARYPWAARIASRVLDVLRIVDNGDIGISVLRLQARSRYTPTIRWTWAWDFEPETAPYQPRRLIYGRANASPLSTTDLAEIRSLVPPRLMGENQQGLEVAFDRFRESCERFEPNDPRRLLDIAIAFEAILLNDGPDKDIGYRLRLRGARWLEERFEGRVTVFRALQNLYKLRSRIAHGDAMESMSHADQVKLAAAMMDGPQMLRQALAMSLRGEGPVNLHRDALQSWWLECELSD